MTGWFAFGLVCGFILGLLAVGLLLGRVLRADPGEQT